MIQLTMLSWVHSKTNLTMTETTLQRRTAQLISEIELHPDREELLQIMQEQLLEDYLDEPCIVID